jgi:hypothetical protein
VNALFEVALWAFVFLLGMTAYVRLHKRLENLERIEALRLRDGMLRAMDKASPSATPERGQEA